MTLTRSGRTAKKLSKAFNETLPRICRDTWEQMSEAQLFTMASSLAYTTLLSIIPLLAVSFAIFQTFGGVDRVYAVVEPLVLSNLAENAGQDVILTLRKFISNAHASTIGVGGMVGLILTSLAMLSSIESAINQVWKTPITRSIFQRVAYYWLFITMGPLALSVAVGVATSSHFPITHLFPNGIAMFALAVGVFFWLYKWVPQTRVKWRYALTAATITSLFWNLARWGYALYIKSTLSYSAVYGSLAAIPIFLLWLYIIWLIVLAGAALTAALQRGSPEVAEPR